MELNENEFRFNKDDKASDDYQSHQEKVLCYYRTEVEQFIKEIETVENKAVETLENKAVKIKAVKNDCYCNTWFKCHTCVTYAYDHMHGIL